MALPKIRRLKNAKTISRVFSGARPQQEAGIALRVLESEQSESLFAVIVPTSVIPKATQRNAIRRRVTEALRRILKGVKVVPRKNVVLTVRTIPTDSIAFEKSIMLLLKKSGILQQ